MKLFKLRLRLKSARKKLAEQKEINRKLYEQLSVSTAKNKTLYADNVTLRWNARNP
jgi:hypothetical protein